MNTAIIVAAGSGSRFGSDQPKQFVNMGGKPLVIWTLERFQECDAIDAIVLVVPASTDHLTIHDHLGSIAKLASTVNGGSTRTGSVRNGIAAMPPATTIVAIHDGARPLVPVDDIVRTIEQAQRTGAACLVAPVTDTIKTVRGDEVSGTLDRTKMRRALTPQAFRVEVIRAAMSDTDIDDATDESMLVERLGHPVAAVEGSSRNIKVTTPDDLIVAAAFLSGER